MMLSEYLLTLILETINMPAEVSAGILALHADGRLDLAMSAFAVGFIMLCVALRPGFFQQAGMALMREPISVIAMGSVWYAIFIALILVFLVSVVGFPVAVLLFLILMALVYIGQASLSVMFREFFADRFHVTLGVYESAFIGAVAIEGVKYTLPWVFQLFILPVIALGAVSVAFSNWYVKKVFYPVHPEKKTTPIDREAIRQIILKSRR